MFRSPLTGTAPEPGFSHQARLTLGRLRRPWWPKSRLQPQRTVGLSTTARGLGWTSLNLLRKEGIQEVGAETQGHGTPEILPGRRLGAWPPEAGPKPCTTEGSLSIRWFLGKSCFLVSPSLTQEILPHFQPQCPKVLHLVS